MEKFLKLLAFDADDTLWDCQSQFKKVEEEYARILCKYGNSEEISSALFKTETANMPLLGYGCKAFTISLVENAVKVSNGEVDPNDILRIVDLGKTLLELKATPLPGVVETLKSIRQRGNYNLVVFTKGELLDQENKLKRSGLTEFFDDAVIVSDKTHEEYKKLCRQYNCDISQFMMIGNSFKSDIEPVLKLGGWAVHIPYHTIWKHEETKEYAHPKLIKLSQFGEIIEFLS